MENSLKLKEILSTPQKIVLLGHVNPDGDAIGSLVSLKGILEKGGHSVTAVIPNDAPRFLSEIKGIKSILNFCKHSGKIAPIIESATMIFCVDFNEIETRIGGLSELVLNNKVAVKVLIDHHLNPPLDSYDISFSDVSAASTSLLVYKLTESLGGVYTVDKTDAEAIYVGLMTDTGNFSYGNLSSELFRIVASLVDCGVSPVEINSSIFNSQSMNRMRLMGFALYNKMRVESSEGFAYITLSIDELNRFHHKSGDTEGLVNLPMSIRGITMSALFIETGECIKISLRSRGAGAVDVNMFARDNFVGGGHRNAAGAKCFGTMDEAVARFLAGIKKLK